MRMPRNAISVGLVLLAVATVYWPDTAALARYWREQDVNAQTGVLIALLSGFLLFRARGRLEQISVGPALWGSLPLIACAAASLICWRAGILTLQLFFLPPLLWLAVLSMLGLQAARSAGFAIGFLYFSLPGWGLLGPTLQRLTGWAVGVIGPPVGLPVAVSGTTAYLPGGLKFVIEPACSGVDFLTVGLAVAMLYGEIEHARLRRRAGLIGGIILLAIVSNWLRVLLILAIGYVSQMRSALASRDHLATGWVVFACALLVFVWAAGRLGATAPEAHAPGGAVGEPVASTVQQGHAVRRYGMAAVALLVVPALVYVCLLTNAARSGPTTTTFELPPGHISWHGPAASAESLWQPKFVGNPVERRARYQSDDGRVVEVVAVGFAKQTQGAQILNERNSLLGDHGLAIEAVTLDDSAGILHGEVIVLDPQGRRSVIWSFIDIGGRLFGEPLSSQLWYGARSLIGTPYSALFALRAQCHSSCDAARAALADFLRANGSALFASLPHSGVAG